jgi:predicted dehydrogenase
MRFLQVGLGSMGKRRLRCLRALGESDVLAFDMRGDRREEATRLYGVRTVDNFEEGLRSGVDAVLISTPPDHHDGFVEAALRAGKHSFCEAGIGCESADVFLDLAAKNHVVAAPSATMRFHPLYRHLHRLLHEERSLGRPLVLSFHVGQYILDWHPWEGLDFYAGRKATGACREMVPFEFCWMQWVFGPVESVQCDYGRQLDLPKDADDTYAILARFVSGLMATVLVDVVARYPVRAGRLLAERGSLEWSFETQKLTHYDGESQSFREHKASPRGYDLEQMYVDEIAAWLEACRGRQGWPHGYADERDLGRILVACERSHETGSRVRPADVAP